MLTGSCLCGAVAYEVDAPAGPIVHCHCSTCRKTHGAAFSTVMPAPRHMLLPHLVLRLLPAALRPVKHLRGRVDLVVMLPLGKHRQLVQVFGEPRRLFWQIDQSRFRSSPSARACSQRSVASPDAQGLPLATPRAHDLVRLRLIAGDRVDAIGHQFLDQLGARGLVLDQYDISRKGLALLAYRPLQFGIFHAPSAIRGADRGSCP